MAAVIGFGFPIILRAMLGTAGISYCNCYFLELNCSRVGKICQLSVGTADFRLFARKVDDVLPTPQVPCERLACNAQRDRLYPNAGS